VCSSTRRKLDDHLSCWRKPRIEIRGASVRSKTEHGARNGKNIVGITFRGCWCGKWWADGRINNRSSARRRFIQLNANVEWKGRPARGRARTGEEEKRRADDSSGRWEKRRKKRTEETAAHASPRRLNCSSRGSRKLRARARARTRD